MPCRLHLRKPSRKYLEVPDTGDPKATQLSDKDREKVAEGYTLATEYLWKNPGDPWAVYVQAYGEATCFHTVPRDLSKAISKLPQKQADLGRHLVLAKERRDWSTLIGTLGAMWQDFSSLVKK